MKLIIITGNVAQDAEVKEITNTRSVVNFTVAINEHYSDKNGQKVEKTTYFECAYWRDTESARKVADVLKKGTKVLVNGDPTSRAFLKADGTCVSAIKIEVTFFEVQSAIKKDNPQS